MKSPICVTNICAANRKQTASFSIVSLMLAIAPLWLMLAAANTSAYAQTSDNVSDASATTSTASSPGDWTQFLRDNMQRWNPYETILNVNNVGGLQLLWKMPIGANYTYHWIGPYSSPAVVNGVVYVGPLDGNVRALNASTGAQLWSYATGGENTFSSPAVANGVVYVGSDKLYALNASTGALLWSYATGSYVASSPAVANGVVYVGGGDGNVYALNASTGAQLWSYADGGALSSPAVANGVVYVGSDHFSIDYLYALNASTGAQLWSFAANDPEFTISSPVVANGVVYISFFQSVYAVNASTGAQLWSAPAGGIFGGINNTAAVANGVVYVSGAARNASTGASWWGL